MISSIILQDLAEFLRKNLGIYGAVSEPWAQQITLPNGNVHHVDRVSVNSDHFTKIWFADARFVVETRFGETTILLADPEYRQKILKLCERIGLVGGLLSEQEDEGPSLKVIIDRI